jgi:hypothetical protein
VRGNDGPVTGADERLRGGWSVCPVGTGKGKHGARGSFSIRQGKIRGRRGATATQRTGEEEEKGRGWGSGLITPHGGGGSGGPSVWATVSDSGPA